MYIIMDVLCLIIRVAHHERSEWCASHVTEDAFYCKVGYIIYKSLETAIVLSLEFYFVLVARQNYLNMRDSLGDNSKHD